MTERGKIRNIGRKQQINDFSGLRYGNITSTDLDGVIEYHNKAYIFIEVKYGDAELPDGQRIAIERLVNDTGQSKISIALVVEHGVDDVNEPVPVAECDVRKYYLSTVKKWKPPKKPITAKELIDAFIEFYVEGENIA